ncbi:demethylmenaquinone methyltransferase/2-methoxy-6-polyprenyl-1,4-benzoquinol methylase [Agrococcus sp. BE272]|uniref:class I SAM-dependent methyltransferase n=1 Tax=Agrococcus sp. SCSIO52902 TaxID=2933290 RepID=UPI001FF23620|nr:MULTISPECIES: class I SAM-dependent methyltransferase [unclassified Agrococcus]MDR7235247.1 demethylmenaquinone methyltransferase/2-methoxy-6-polyprenyl-1,4-benzoquinol methylase [Agrococcus sp. BE272]UOW01353.1 class I SAM-dependent methyltransferase [Agrococcus sp. SCSIO52902]
MSRADMQKDPDQVAGMFDATAKRYDLLNSLLSGGNDRLWRIHMQRAVAPKPGERILDVAAGTGASSAPMAKAGALVTALDISHGMLEEGRRRHPDIEFVQGSAEELPFDGDTFDAVTISFGLRNVQQPRAALSEFHRVLKPGGRLVVCEFSQPPVNVVRKSYELYLRTVLPGLAKAASSNPEAYRYLVESIASWPDQQALSQWIRTAGFIRVAHRNLTLGVVALHRGRKPSEQTAAMRLARHAQPEEQGS